MEWTLEVVVLPVSDLIVIDEVNDQLVFERHENASTDYLNLKHQNNYIN